MVKNTPRWKELLYDRGINDEQIDYYGLQPSRIRFVGEGEETALEFPTVSDEEAKGWSYPMVYYDHPEVSITRFKLFPGSPAEMQKWGKNRSPKKSQLPFGGRHPEIYIAHADEIELIRETVAQDGRRLWGVEGEFDKILLSGFNMYNTIAFFGVGNLPLRDLADIISEFGATEFHYFHDNDPEGVKAAFAIHNALVHTRIKPYTHTLPQEYNGQPVKDITDLWKACRDDEEFAAVLEDCKAQFTKMPDPKSVRRNLKDRNAAPEFWADVERTLHARSRHGIKNFKQSGFSNNIECIFAVHEHDDVAPSAVWSRDTGVFFCHKCAQGWSILDVAKQLGIDPDDYAVQQQLDFDGGMEAPNYTPKAADSNRVDVTRASAVNAIRNTMPVTGDIEGAPIESFLSVRSKVLKRARERVEGTAQTNAIYIPFPMDDPQFSELGGYCKMMKAGKLALLIAHSGGGKTTIMTDFVLRLNQRGISTIVWSPEFDEEEHTDRQLQQVGAPSMTRMIEHDQSLYERQNPDALPAEGGYGSPLSPQEQRRALAAIDVLEGYRGDNFLINAYGTSVFDVLAMADRIYDYALNVEGKRPLVFMFDYASLPQDPVGVRSWSPNENAKLFKQWCSERGERVSEFTGKPYMRLPLLGFMTSQATKLSTKQMKTGGQDVLMEEDAQNLRPDWFNLIMTARWGKMHSATNLQRMFIFVVKNSTGRRFWNLEALADAGDDDPIQGRVRLWFNPNTIGIQPLEDITGEPDIVSIMEWATNERYVENDGVEGDLDPVLDGDFVPAGFSFDDIPDDIEYDDAVGD